MHGSIKWNVDTSSCKMLPGGRLANVIRDMNEFGICVVDGFLGVDTARELRRETVGILTQRRELFKNGEVINGSTSQGGLVIRGDQIAWLEGTEDFCPQTRFFIRSLDSLISSCIASDNVGEMGLHKINQRTKAMMACYPGGGSRYYKHVDNPNFDGRKITCVYYLNEPWDCNTNGGCLRIYPQGRPDQVATVQPILDRLVMFWSDRRNPHEVMPSQKVRLSITVWYLDDNELCMQNCVNSALQQNFHQITPFMPL